MNKIYLYTAMGGLFFTVYIFGHYVGFTACAQESLTQTIEYNQIQNDKKEKINAEIYRTGIGDIRDILRTKYTIAE